MMSPGGCFCHSPAAGRTPPWRAGSGLGKMRPMVSPLPALEPLPVAALPPRLAALADPDTPLEHPERFVPGEALPVAGAFVALLAGGALGFGLFGAALYAWGSEGDDPAGRYLAPLLSAVAWARAAAGWLTLKRARARRDRLDHGRWRRGLFVLDDGLLLVVSGRDGPRGRWIPRRMIAGVDERRHPAALLLDGGDSLEVPGEPSALARRLEGWRAGRPFAWEERV